jgi:hypothetical protein
LNCVFQVHITGFIFNKPTLSFQIQYGNPKIGKKSGQKLKKAVANKWLTRFEFVLKTAP